MRRLLFPALAFLFAVALLASPVTSFAGNVLLPKESGSSSGGPSSMPNLGLSVAPQPQKPPPSSKTQNPANSGQSKSPSTNKPGQKQRLPYSNTDVQYQTDMSGIIAARDRNLPNQVTITIDKKSTYAEKDFAEIGSKLGLDRRTANNTCIVSVGGTLQTSTGDREIYSGISSQAKVRYEGIVNGYQLSVSALCPVSGSKPPDPSALTRIDGRYVIPLANFSCPTTKNQDATLTVSYQGGNATCAYK